MHRIDTAPLLHLPQDIQLRWQRRVLHFHIPATTSRGALKERVTYIIEAECNGHTGYGECCVMPGLLPELTAQQLDYWCQAAMHGRCAVLQEAPSPIRFGIETAVLSAIQGGKPRWDTPFAQGKEGVPIHCLIWMSDTDTMLSNMQTGIEQGFTCLKMKVGALPFEQEIAMLREARSAFPAAEIRVDANGAFEPETALEKLEQLADLGVSYIEQPVRPVQWQAMARLCRESPLPIALDEELIGVKDAEQMLGTIKPQAIVIKPSLHGGLLATEHWAETADKLGIYWWVNSALESNVGLTALAEWCAYTAPRHMQGLGTGRLFTDDIPGPVRLLGTQLVYR